MLKSKSFLTFFFINQFRIIIMLDIVWISNKSNKQKTKKPLALLVAVVLALCPWPAGYSHRILGYGCSQRWCPGLWLFNTLLLNHPAVLHTAPSPSLQRSNKSNLLNYRHDPGDFWLQGLTLLIKQWEHWSLRKLGYKVYFVHTYTMCFGSSQH